MEINIKIDEVEIWYRKSDKKWVIDIAANTDNVSLGLRYTGKKLNDAKRRLFKNFTKDLLEQELIYRFRHLKINFSKGE